MRFETPQTTPSLVNRRFQRGMLSIVGVIFLVVLVGVIFRTPSTVQLENQAAAPGGSHQSDASSNKTALDPGNPLTQVQIDQNGPRGQWMETPPRDRSRDVVPGQDREPFQRRGQERPRDLEPFSRRAMNQTDFEEPRPNNGSPSREIANQDFDRDNIANAPSKRSWDFQNITEPNENDFNGNANTTPSRRRQPDRTVNTPTQDDDAAWERDSFSQQSPRGNALPGGNYLTNDNPLPGGNSLPGSNTLPGSNSLPDSVNDFPRDDVPRVDRRRDSDAMPTTNPIDRRYRNDSQPQGVDESNPFADGADLRNPPPTRRRTPDGWENPLADNGEPFQQDVASVRIDKRYLDLVKDNTVGVRRDEAEVFYWLLDHARRVSSNELERAGLTEVQYINLMTEPDRFRGEPVTIEGDLWALYEFDASRNDYGIGRIYEGWVFTGDSGNRPFRIVMTSLPRGIIPGENIRKPVRLTGYFFKREGYQSQGGIHFAPVLLARRIQINPLPNGLSFPNGFTPHIVGVLMALGLALLVTVVGFSLSDERSSQEQMQRLRHYPQLSFANLPAPDFVSIDESLRQLSEREHHSAIRGAYGPLLSRQTLREHSLKSFVPGSSDESLVDSPRPAEVVHNWAHRQQQIQAEIDSLRSSSKPAKFSGREDDDLDSDRLAPARNLLPREPKPARPAVQPETRSFSAPIAVSPAISPPPVPYEPRTIAAPVVTNPHPIVSQLHSVVTTPASNIDYRASKLSEWEDEVTKLQNLPGRPHANWMRTEFSRESVADQIERDRVTREQEVQAQIHHPVAEPKRHFESQVEQEWAEHERHRHEQDSVAEDHADFDLEDDDLSSDDDISSTSYDEDVRNRDQTGQNRSSNKPAWGRNRKRRRNWRDGNAS